MVVSQKSDKTAAIDSTRIYLEKHDYLRAQSFAARYCEETLARKDYHAYTKGLITYSDIFVLLNDKKKAQEIMFKGVKTIEAQNNAGLSALLWNNIGTVHAKFMDNKIALPFLRRAWKLALKSENDTLLRKCEQSLVRAYSFVRNKDSSLYLMNRIIRRAERSKNPRELYGAYNNAYVYYYFQDEKARAKPYLDSVKKYAYLTGDKQPIGRALTNEAAYFITVSKDYKAAKRNYEQFFAMNPNDTTSYDMGDYYYTYSDILAKLGLYEETVKYLEKAIAIRDNAYAEGKNRLIWEMEGKYKIQKIEDGFAEKEREAALAQQRKNIVLLIMLAILVVSGILFYFFLQNTRLKQKNKLQVLQNETQQKILGATMDGQESERHKIAGVLHDNISAMLSSATMQLTAFSMKNPENSEAVKKARQIIGMAHESVRELSHELVPVLLSKFGLAHAVQECCERNSSDTLHIEADISGDPELRFETDFETKVFFIASELLNNTIKHSGAKKATIRLGMHTDRISLEIQDNGKGFPSNASDGFGLTQIKARVATMNGTISIASGSGGTHISLMLPVPASRALA